MKSSLKLFNDDIGVDTQKFLDGKLLLQANTGGGKSWATRRIVEQFAGIVPQIILDPEGEFFTLRQKFPDFILIGKGQPITADPKSAGLLAHKLIEERVSCIIDLLEMPSMQRDLFVKNFVQAMINAPRHLWLPTLLTIDEAQIFAPENGQSETASVLKDAGFRFRKRHYGMILATPRISELSKSVASTCKNKLIGQASLDNDMKRSAAELGFTTKEEIATLRDLDPGEFYAYGPAFSKRVIRLKIGKTLTQHGDSASVNARVATPSPKVQKALEALANVPQAAADEAKSIAELTAENRRLRATSARPAIDQDAIKKAVERAVAARDKEWDGKVAQERAGWQRQTKGYVDALKDIERALKRAGMSAEIIYPAKAMPLPKDFMLKPGAIINTPPQFDMINAAAKNLTDAAAANSDAAAMGKGERAVLIACVQQEGCTREHLTVLTGYTRSSRNTYIQRLQARGYLRAEGNKVVATAEGADALGSDYQPLPTGIELQEQLMRMLPEGEKRILRALIDAHPDAIERESLSEATGYTRSSRNTYIQRLSARELVVTESGMVRASDKLF